MRLCPLLLAACALAQAPQKAAGPPSTPLILAEPLHVQVNVIVHDKKGQPVPDLKKNDFDLYDRGKDESVSSFRVDSTGLPVPRLTMPPGTSTNNLSYRDETPTSGTVILFDLLNMNLRDEAQAKQQLMRVLREVEFQDSIAIYVLGDGLAVLHDLNDSPTHLLHLLDGIRDSAAVATAITVLSGLDKVDRTQTTLSALGAIANHVAGFPGRKNLVWVSGAFPIKLDAEVLPGGQPGEAERVALALGIANVAIYPVAAPGFTPKNPGALDALAEVTGGRAFPNGGVSGAIRKAVDDAVATYTLAFHPPQGDLDGKYHKLQVKLPGMRGLDVHARGGYIAFWEVHPSTERQRAAVRDTIESPIDATGIGLYVRPDPSGNPEKGKVRLRVQIDASTVNLQAQAAHYLGLIEFTTRQLSASGKTIVSSTETVKLSFEDPLYREVVKSGILFTMSVTPVKDAAVVRLVVLDRQSGRIGSVHVPLTEPRP